MTEVLNAWMGDTLVGSFTCEPGERTRFLYAEPDGPVVSLSLPRGGEPRPGAADAWLENLLPESAQVRARWAAAHGVSTDSFHLLSAVGQDAAGALVLLPPGQTPHDTPAAVARPLTEDDIAARIAGIVDDPAAWAPPTPGARFSLSGTQGKFSLAHVGEDWFTSSATLPSTHIIKPEPSHLPGIASLEAAVLNLASMVGLPAAKAEVWHLRGTTAFVAERFDRDLVAGVPRRLHAEDLTQALGLRPEQKYQVRAAQVIEPLHLQGGDLVYDWIGQLAFNAHVGNSDAHAKNYTVLLTEHGVHLAPLYDAVVTSAWPGYDQTLAMHIGGQAHAAAVTPDHWAKLARRTGLDAERVVHTARTVAAGIRAHAHEAMDAASVPRHLADQVMARLDATTRQMTQARRGAPAPAFPFESPALPRTSGPSL